MTETKEKIKLGAHKSAAGGFEKAAQRVHDISGDVLQLFSYSPRSWQSRELSDEEVENFLSIRDELGVGPAYFHSCYLINLADRAQTGEKSVKNLIAELTLASRADIVGSVIHTGSWKTDDNEPEDADHYEHLLENIRTVLENTPDDTYMLLENSGNEKIGRDVTELYQIINDIGSNRVRVCLDTCHLHAAGYDLSNEEGFEDFFSQFDEEIGLERLELIHVNDSRDEAGSLRDRHANIGEGKIPEKVFELLVNRPETREKPLVIETPGFGDSGPDKKNLNLLRGMVQ